MSSCRAASLGNCQSFLERYFLIQKSVMQATQYCYTHRGFCRYVRVSFVSAGLPCQPNSRSGYGHAEHDARFACYIVFALFHIMMGTALLMLENVVDPRLHFIRFVSLCWFVRSGDFSSLRFHWLAFNELSNLHPL